MKKFNPLILNEYLKLYIFVILFQVALGNQSINVYLINWVELIILIQIQDTSYYRQSRTIPLSLEKPFIITAFNPYLYSYSLWKVSYYSHRIDVLIADCQNIGQHTKELDATCEKVKQQLINTAAFLNQNPEQQTIDTRCQYYFWKQYYFATNQKIINLSKTYRHKRKQLNQMYEKLKSA